MGNMLTEDGLKPDTSKIIAVEQIPPPKDKQAVQRLLGMTNSINRDLPQSFQN